MRRWLGAIIGIVGVIAAAIVVGNVSWSRMSARVMRRLDAPPTDASTQSGVAISEDELATLPPSVARYFKFALSPGQRTIEHARFSQEGTMRTDADAPWKRFTAVEEFATRPIGFVWDASMTMMPLVPIRIRDGYVDGQGASEAKIAATIPVGKKVGTPEVTSASLVRYLAEAAWLPTALLPNSGVSWTSLEGDHARATLSDGGTTVSIDIEFGSNEEIVRVSAMRFRDVNGTPVLTRWIGHYSKYERVEGMMIPMEAEVAWSPPEGAFSVWRGRITDARYRFAVRP